MLHLEFQYGEYGMLILLAFWSVAGFLGAYIAWRKERNPVKWGIICLVVPFMLFATLGMQKPKYPDPEPESGPESS